MRRCAGALLAVLAPVLAVPGPAAAAGAEQPAFRLLDDAIDESSGLVLSRSRPGLAYTVNDSGDSARVFTVDTGTGRVVGQTRLAGVDAVDVEALAFAPGGRLVVGDIGDNTASRDSVDVHLIGEPAPGNHEVRPRTTRLVYPDGPRDAEALLVRDGRLFVVSKRVLSGTVYRGPRLDALGAAARLRPVASAPGVVTDATVMADGRVLLRNYTAAFVLGRDWSVRQTLQLPRMPQGETLAAAPQGSAVYAGTEGARSPVYRIDIPRGRPAAEPTSTPEPTAEPTDGRPAGDAPSASGSGDAAPGPVVWGAGTALAAVAGVLVAWWVRRRTRS